MPIETLITRGITSAIKALNPQGICNQNIRKMNNKEINHSSKEFIEVSKIVLENIQFPNFTSEFLRRNYIENTITHLTTSIKNTSFTWWKTHDDHWMLYQTATNQFWWIGDLTNKYNLNEGKKKATETEIGNIQNWNLPSKDEIIQFSRTADNPMRSGQSFRIYNYKKWICQDAVIDLDNSNSNSYDSGRILFSKKLNGPSINLIGLAIKNKWKLSEGGIKEEGVDRLAVLCHPDLKTLLADLDHAPCRLPKLDAAQFTDPNKGLWEAWGLSEAEQTQHGLRARDPARDLREGFVAIDFGTSSTVVAWDDNGRAKLMRVGVKDFWAQQRPGDYENPTVLEFIDLPAMLSAWQSSAYRPGVRWDQVRCSHEALHNWRNNESNPQVVGSILGKIKQWALRQENDYRLRITDQANGFEHEFAPLQPRNPVKGQPLTVGDDDAFDPIELYAWFLGMNINWRQQGLFLKYYMSFPVDYPQAVKDNILAAFRRGLQRSLPETLVRQPVFSEFRVEERASEPAAYAAIALPTLGIAPGADSGEGYAVFDFGGGTADFDFGFYRQPTPEEEDEGWEAVFERCGSAGDKFLGGENLLEHLAYLTLRHNLDLCRDNRIAFTRPLDAEDFPGSEMFLEKTRAAATNTLMLMSRLRPLWETGALPDAGSGVTKIDLLNREGAKVSCELAIPSDALLKYLEQRIEKGVQSFFVALRAAFGADLPGHVHILLAGNASRSEIVSRLFGLVTETESEHSACARTQRYLYSLFGDDAPVFTAHPPLAADEDNAYRPTGKTGVALGLLKLCPGSAMKIIDHARYSSGDEAPFAYHVGRIRLGKFQPGLRQGSAYGDWHELGVPRERVFNLYYTQSPLAHTGTLEEGHMDLNKRPLHLTGNQPGQKVFGRAIKPSQIEICTAASRELAEQGQFENWRTLDLS